MKKVGDIYILYHHKEFLTWLSCFFLVRISEKKFNPKRAGLFWTISQPGGGGAYSAPP